MPDQLEIKDLHVSIEGREIVKGLNLTVNQGETHALMGPNGSGKSTLAYALMGHSKYKITGGNISYNGQSILTLTPDKRAKLGLFLAFQYPMEIPGVPLAQFLRSAYRSIQAGDKKVEEKKGGVGQEMISALAFRKTLIEKIKFLDMDESFASRYLNEGFSGGEKKRAEVLQMSVLKPKIAIMDETDSGLDIDALRKVAEAVNTLKGPELGILLITHYQRILRYIHPEFVHVMFNGSIVKSGGSELAEKLEELGYEWIEKELGLQAAS